MSSAWASLHVCLKGEMQQVCLQALVTALLEPLLLSSPGCLCLSSQSLLALPALTWSCLACPWVQGWLEWLLSEVRLQEGPSQLGSSKCAVAPSLHTWFPLTRWELKCASSQIVYFGSWLVHSLASFGDL